MPWVYDAQGIFRVIYMKKKMDVKKLVLLAMLSALSFVAVATIRIPVVEFLKYEPKDVIITIGGFLFGPPSAAIISILVGLVEMLTISDTGPIGCLMNILSSCSFACTAAIIYKKRHTHAGALWGLLSGTVLTVGIMLLWNWLITPLYLGYPRQAVEQMLVPVFLPFNLLKGGINSSLVMLLYKPLTNALRKARLLPPASAPSKSRIGVIVLALAVLATCTLFILALQGII